MMIMTCLSRRWCSCYTYDLCNHNTGVLQSPPPSPSGEPPALAAGQVTFLQCAIARKLPLNDCRQLSNWQTATRYQRAARDGIDRVYISKHNIYRWENPIDRKIRSGTARRAYNPMTRRVPDERSWSESAGERESTPQGAMKGKQRRILSKTTFKSV